MAVDSRDGIRSEARAQAIAASEPSDGRICTHRPEHRPLPSRHARTTFRGTQDYHRNSRHTSKLNRLSAAREPVSTATLRRARVTFDAPRRVSVFLKSWPSKPQPTLPAVSRPYGAPAASSRRHRTSSGTAQLSPRRRRLQRLQGAKSYPSLLPPRRLKAHPPDVRVVSTTQHSLPLGRTGLAALARGRLLQEPYQAGYPCRFFLRNFRSPVHCVSSGTGSGLVPFQSRGGERKGQEAQSEAVFGDEPVTYQSPTAGHSRRKQILSESKQTPG